MKLKVLMMAFVAMFMLLASQGEASAQQQQEAPDIYEQAEMEADRVPLSNEKSTTGIDGIVADGADENVIFYDLNGRRVAKPQKGIYIANGKKVLFE